jgi:hypothetical protein
VDAHETQSENRGVAHGGCAIAHAGFKVPDRWVAQQWDGSFLNLSPLSAWCGVNLREGGSFCIHWCSVICYCASNDFAHTYAPRPAGLLVGIPSLW